MKRNSWMALATVVVATGVIVTTQAQSQLGTFKNYVGLQASSPGTAQSGNLNISGTAKALVFEGGFSGNGSLLTHVDALFLNGNPASAFMPANPVPLTLTGSPTGPILQVSQLMPGERGIMTSSSASDALYAATVSGTGVNAIAGSGTAVEGFAGSGIGIRGASNNAAGIGISASNTGGGFALSVAHKARFIGELQLIGSGNISVRAGEGVPFPITLESGNGPKISLGGLSPTAFPGLSMQGNTVRLHSATSGDSVAIGYGAGGSFVDSVHFRGADTVALRPDNSDNTNFITTPYDFVFGKDRDNDNSNAWFMFMTNNSIEQMRINDGDEAATLFDGAVTANGIDFAEGFKVHDPSLEPGDLVINAGANWEYIGRSSQPYQSGVIGVISTKPAFVAGMSFDAEDKIDPALTRRRDDARRKGDDKLAKELTIQMRRKVEEAYRPVAFMGRVPVKVVGPVKVGDKLTASAIPGVAMAMTQGGHSIGIALEASAGGQTKVMAMIQPGHVAGADVTADPGFAKQIRKLEAENQQLRRTASDLQARLERIEQLLAQRSR